LASGYELAKKDLAERLRDPSPISRDEFERLKREVACKHSLTRVPSNPEILALLDPESRELVKRALLLKSTRSASGVVVVAVMASPHPCPHGRCIYCPGGPASGTPQSYTGHEPAAMRAIQNRFDPSAQVVQRMRQLEQMGHSTDKVELIIMGGTFPSAPLRYQEWFVKECLDALNCYRSASLEEAKRLCRNSRRRNVALTIETRPDHCKEPHVDSMLDMGATRVEIGLQSVYDDVLDFVGRGHAVKDSVDAIRIAKDSGLKVVVHMMPGLPGSDQDRDVKAFRVLFEDEKFRPDMLKIYPTLVLAGTGLEKLYRSGSYSPLDDATATEIVARVFEMAPRWLRVMRVQRDIPANLILAGPKHGNLRELSLRLLSKRGLRTSEIRSREIGLRNAPSKGEGLELKLTPYASSSGQEVLLEIAGRESDLLVAYLRLRLPSPSAHRPELSGGESAIVRELKVLGRSTPIGKVWADSSQHRGHGAFLMGEAERLARDDWGVKKLLVTSALGTKGYYERMSYRDDGPYMSKSL